jgi:phosphate transport system protein
MIGQRVDEIKRQLLYFEALVELMIERSIQGLKLRDKNLLREVEEDLEPQSNKLEVEMEKLCTRTLAQFSPKAKDLRILLMILKMNNDLERMGDLAVGIARSGLYLIERPKLEQYTKVMSNMGDIAIEMVRDSFSAFIDEDAGLALDICNRDILVNQLRNRLVKDLTPQMESEPLTVGRAVELIAISNRIERIADLATNIAEDVVYVVKGVVIKHQKMSGSRTEFSPKEASTPDTI